jgi:hypothetical protein
VIRDTLTVEADDDLQPRAGGAPLRIAAHLIVQAIRFAVALPSHDALHGNACRMCIERQMFDAVALFRCPP